MHLALCGQAAGTVALAASAVLAALTFSSDDARPVHPSSSGR